MSVFAMRAASREASPCEATDVPAISPEAVTVARLRAMTVEPVTVSAVREAVSRAVTPVPAMARRAVRVASRAFTVAPEIQPWAAPSAVRLTEVPSNSPPSM